MNEGTKQTIRKMKTYIRLSYQLDKLEDEIGEMVYQMSDEDDRRFRHTAISKRYWMRLIAMTVAHNSKLIIRILRHHPVVSRNDKLSKNFAFTYKS